MKKTFTILIAALMLLTMISQPTKVWGQVLSGTTYSTLPGSLPTNWSGLEQTNNSSSYFSLTYSSNYIQTPNIAQNGFTSIIVKARMYGGPSDAQKAITVSWYDATTNTETVLTTISPTSKTLSNYTVAVKDFTNTPTANTTGYIKLQCKNSGSNKGSGVSEVTITYTAHTITYSATNGSISGTKVDGGATVNTGAYLALGEQVTVTATPASAAYTFESWSVSGTGSSVAYSTDNPTTFTMGSANTTLTANFVAASSDPTITINTPTGGTIAVEDDDDNTIANGDQIAEGTSLYISATPNVGYSFGEWSVTETSSGDDVELLYDLDENENAFEMPGVDVTVDATFTKNKYNVAVLSVDDITITASYGVSNTITEGNNKDVDYQTSISLNATDLTPGKDYDWKITNSSDVDVTDAVLSGTTVTVPAYNIKIGATIVNTYTVTYDANSGTGTMTDSDSPYRDGSEVTIMTNTFTRANYAFSGWNTANDGSGASYDEGETFTISGNITLYAQWVPSYTITTSATNGTIEVYQSSKPAGDTVRLKVTPSSGYDLVGLKVKKTEGGFDTDIVPEYNNELKRYIFTMPAYDVTVKGVFDATNEVTYDFSDISGFNDWDTYAEHSVSYDDAIVTFASAMKQTTTITDIPVTKGSEVSLVMKESGGDTKKITGATFVCRQWGTKTQTITFHSSKNTGSTYQTYVGLTSTNFTISNDTLRSGVDAVKITFSSSSNQVGIESATILIKGDAHSITCATGLTGGSISSSPTSASQGETVELTAVPDANYALDSWTVTYTAGGETFSIPVANNKFTMPNFAVNVTASFRSARDLTVKYSINGTVDDDLEQEVTEGGSVDIQGIPVGVTPTGYTFAGWSASASDLSTLLAADDSYTPSDNVTLYAVFTATKPAQFTLSITTSDFNSTSYAANNNAKTTAANAVSGETMNVTWTSNQVMQSGGMQWQKDNGYIYNSTDLGTIQSVTITKSAGTFTTYYGTTAQPTEGDAGTGKGYFKTSVGNATGTTSEVKVTFVKSITRKFTRIIDDDVNVSTTVTLTAPAIIESGKTLTIEDGGILNAGNYLTILDGGSLIIEDGGQLITTMSGITATVKKETYAATAKDAKTDYYWYAISSAVANPIILSATNLTEGTYDLYRYNETKNAGLPWENYKNTAYSSTFTTLEPGRGYLYRNASDLSITMTGEINVADFNYEVTKTGSGVLAGFNLIGNPYSHDIYKGAGTAIPNGTDFLRTGFYYMDPTIGKWTLGTDNSTAIKPNQGILVQTDATGDIAMTNTTASAAKYNNDNIMFKVANSQYSDEAYAWFDKGRGLNKISHRNAEVPMLYIRQDGEDYAIATMSDDTKMFSLNFKAMTMGKYTLSYKTKGEFNYLHVIDRLTGEDVDMLLEGEYSFVASPSDSDARFIVKLAYLPDYSDGEGDIFAYQNGSDIFVSGEGELQIFDVMGRFVMSERINGVKTISADELSKGVYVLRLVGSGMKTQKIVVK